MSALLSRVALFAKHVSVTPPAAPVTQWVNILSPVEYWDYYSALFDETGGYEWSENGRAFSFSTSYNEATNAGATSIEVHLSGALPGVFEVGVWNPSDTDPDTPGEVHVFEFTSRVITGLPISQVDTSDPEFESVPVMLWRFWPGRLAELRPT